MTRALASRSEFVTSYTPVPTRGGPGRAPGGVRVPDARGPPVGPGGRQRLALRRRRVASSRRSTWRWAPRDGKTSGCRTASTRRGARCSRPSRRAPATGSTTSRSATGSTDWAADGVRRRRRPRRRRGRLPQLPGLPRGPRPRPGPVCDRTGALLVVAFDPVCAGILRSPGRLGRRRGGGGGPGARHAPRLRRARTSGCSPARWTTCGACPAAWWARPSTPRDGAPTSPPCAPANRTSAARRPRPTSAPTRPSWR